MYINEKEQIMYLPGRYAFGTINSTRYTNNRKCLSNFDTVKLEGYHLEVHET